MSDQELVKKCLLRACRKLGFEPAAMMQRDFELLSEEIETKTGILISVSTLKRLLNGEFSRLPQTATLNAVSSYLGFKNWHDYKLSEKEQQGAIAVEEEKHNKPVQAKKTAWPSRWKMIAAVVLVLGTITVAGFLTISSKSPSNFEKASFSVKKTVTKGIPNTVVFNYNIDEVNADSFFIQQSWDERRRVRIYKKTYTLTDIYYEPGYHKAKLIANDKIIRTFDVSIPTDGWFLFAEDHDPKSIPEYIKVEQPVKNGIFSITKEDLAANHIDEQKPKNYVYMLFPGKLDVSSDNYVYKARVRVKEVRNNFCPQLMCEIFCQSDFMYFRSTPKGCVNEALVQFGENAIRGKTNDLSSLGLDITQWVDVEIMVKDKLATISLNGNKAYSVPYKISSGYLTGLGFISNGLCEVDFVTLKGLDGKEVYSNEFN